MPGIRVAKTWATSLEHQSFYPWHFGQSFPLSGPVIGENRLTGGSAFGFDPFEMVALEVAQNPNFVIAGAPANGKSAFVKAVLWYLVGAFGYRMVVTDVKGEYVNLAEALGVPVLRLHPGGAQQVNPLEVAEERLGFVLALASLVLERSLQPIEQAAIAAAERALPDHPMLEDFVQLLREFPASMCDELVVDRADALGQTQALRFGLGGLLNGDLAGMFNGRTNVSMANSDRGFVVDISACGKDDRVLSLALLAAQRAAGQLVSSKPGRTLQINDEGWRTAGTDEGVRWMQSSFKLGRNDAISNGLIVHRFSEIGEQSEGSTSRRASRLVSDADIHVMFRQGDDDDARETIERLKLPDAARTMLTQFPRYRCLIKVRDRLAVVDTRMSSALKQLTFTNQAMTDGSRAGKDS